MPMQTGLIIVRRHGLPPWLNTVEAAGQAQGGPADASAGLQKMNDARGTWAWNPLYNEWQLLRVIRSGDTLWAMSGEYYGERSVPGVHRIGNIDQNQPILGSTYDRAVPGDVILIPQLQQPVGAPPQPPGDGAIPPPGGSQPPGLDLPPGGIDWTAPEPPPNWPPDWPWPPGNVTPPITLPTEPPYEPPPGTPPQLPPGNGAAPTPVGATTPGAEEKFWTNGKIALIGGLALGTIGLVVWGATRGAKQKRRSPRRRTQRRRRRR